MRCALSYRAEGLVVFVEPRGMCLSKMSLYEPLNWYLMGLLDEKTHKILVVAFG